MWSITWFPKSFSIFHFVHQKYLSNSKFLFKILNNYYPRLFLFCSLIYKCNCMFIYLYNFLWIIMDWDCKCVCPYLNADPLNLEIWLNHVVMTRYPSESSIACLLEGDLLWFYSNFFQPFSIILICHHLGLLTLNRIRSTRSKPFNTQMTILSLRPQ